jgi:hypothetical protein
LAPRPRKKPLKERKRPEEHGEKCLHLHCAKWLADAHPRLLAFHVPNERRGGVGTGVHFKRMGVRAGVADWLLFDGGRALAIELKDTDGKLRPEQEAFERQWTACGNAYVVCRTLEQFQGAVAALVLFS